MHFLIVDIHKRLGDTGKPQYVVQRLSEELKKRDIPCDLCSYQDLTLSLGSGTYTINVLGTPLEAYSHIIMRGHRTPYEYMLKQYVVQYAESHGIVVQNAEFIKKWLHYNKILQMQYCSAAGLPYPDSAYCIDGRYWEKKELLGRLGFPIIFKHIEGEYRIEVIDGKEKFKKNVFLAHSVDELKELSNTYDQIEDNFTTKPSRFFLQKYIDSGVDYRAIMLGGKYVSGWKREATKSFLTVSSGEYSLYENPDPGLKELAEKTAAALSADYCAIDMIYSNETPYILEVNMNPGFKAFETKVKGVTIDMASAIIDQILTK